MCCLVTEKKSLFKFCAVLFFCVLTGPLWAASTVENLLAEVSARRETFLAELAPATRRDLQKVKWTQRHTLSPSLRTQYETWHQLNQEQDQWTHALELKQELLALLPEAERTQASALSDADRLSQEILKTLYEKREEWGMLNTALLNNALVNLKFKEKGFCWHWVDAFLAALRPLHVKHFDLHRGVAHQGNFRENNSLVITRAGGEFRDGLMIDAWRASGKPFWRLVTKDHYPWVKRTDIPDD